MILSSTRYDLIIQDNMEKHILLLTHGNFADGILSSLAVIGANQSQLHTICLQEDDSRESIEQRISSFINKRKNNAVVFILTDIPFGSTTQIAFSFLDKPDVYLVSGLNLGLLLGIVLEPMDSDPVTFIRSVLDKAKKTLMMVNDSLNECYE